MHEIIINEDQTLEIGKDQLNFFFFFFELEKVHLMVWSVTP